LDAKDSWMISTDCSTWKIVHRAKRIGGTASGVTASITKLTWNIVNSFCNEKTDFQTKVIQVEQADRMN